MAEKKFNPDEHMMDLKGKKYLQVMWRLVWFREEHPDWTINTEMVEHGQDFAVFKAEIIDEEKRLVSTGYGSESIKDFRDYLEKAETKSVGRALAMLGYGTQFAPELDEGERIVDSPVAIAVSTETQIVTKEMVEALTNELARTGNDVKPLLDHYKISKLEEMSCAAWKSCMNALKGKPNK